MNTNGSRIAKDTASAYHHFTIGERRIIEARLNAGASFTAIAAELGVSTSTVSREVKRNRSYVGPSYSVNRFKNDCVHVTNCKVRGLCGRECGRRSCHACGQPCHTFGCPEYEPRACAIHRKAPWVCNACKVYALCPRERVRYASESAQALAAARYSDARSGIDMEPEELERMARTVREGLALGQSIHHIFAVNDLPASERSFYRYVERSQVPIISLELPKKVRYRKRAAKGGFGKAAHEAAFYQGRTYEDYVAYVQAHGGCARCQGDTVVGARPGRARILTIHRPDLHFQFFVKTADGTARSIVEALDWLERCCVDPKTGESRFEEIFGVMLLDRGSEFDDIEGLERSALAEPGAAEPAKRCHVFFTDPRRPDQKGAAEKNHVELRKILPKGTSFDHLSAADVADICSRVNSTVRRSLGNETPFARAKRMIPQFVFDNLGLKEIDAHEVRMRMDGDIPF